MTPSPAHVIKQVESTLNSVTDGLLSLYGRWMDEREYESFDDYATVMAKWLVNTKGVRFVSAKKRPFGFEVSVDGFDATYLLYANSRAVGWKRVS